VKYIQLLAALAIGALFLFLAFRGIAFADEQSGIPWADIGASIAATSWWGCAGFLVIALVQMLLRVQKWRIQIRGLTGALPSFRTSFAINAVSEAAVFLLPFRLGEFVRPNLAAQRRILNASAGLAGSALEHVVDGIVVTGAFPLVLWCMRGRAVPAYVHAGGALAFAIFAGALLFFVAAYRWRDPTSRAVEWLLRRVHGVLAQKVGALLRAFLDGLACFRRPRDLVAYLSLTLAYWWLNVAAFYVLMRGMHIDVEPTVAFFLLCMLVIGMMIPAPPSNVGNFHAFATGALMVFEVPPVAAVAYAVMLHAISTASIALLGALFFVTRDIGFATFKTATQQSEAVTRG
jgi:uncharacterized protein (TIRG00374 family)